MDKKKSILQTYRDFAKWSNMFNKTDLYFYYAKWILQNKFPEGEAIIAKDAFIAYWYADEIIKGRFPKGEKIIFNSVYKDNYELSVLRKLGLTWRDLGYE